MNNDDKCLFCGADAVYRPVEMLSEYCQDYVNEFAGYKCGSFIEERGERSNACVQAELTQLRQFKRVVLANVKREDDEVPLDEFIQIGCGHMAVCEFYVGRVYESDVAAAFEHAVKIAAESERNNA